MRVCSVFLVRLRGRQCFAFALGGFAYGLVTSRIPSPHGGGVFWVGNLCAPWLVLAFMAGRAQRSLGSAALAGALTEIACVVGFYVQFLTLDALRLGLPHQTPLTEVATTSLSRWLVFISPWLVAALAAGPAYGVLGQLWGRSKALVSGLALALPFLAEPALWPLANGYYKGPGLIWAGEVTLGLLIVVAVLRTRRRLESSDGEGPTL